MHDSPLLHDALRVLDQGARLAERLSDRGWAEADGSHVGASVGAHVRHVLDHYLCFVAGASEGVVDYDRRARDPRIEVDRHHALRVIAEVRAALLALPPGPLSVRAHAGAFAEEDGGLATSSVARELVFVASHAIHHYALVAVELRARGIEVEPGFGVAPATLGYRQATA